MSILVFNAGSSSLKFGLFDAEACRPLASGGIDWADGDRRHAKLLLCAEPDRPMRATVSAPDDQTAARLAMDWLAKADGGRSGSPAAIEAVGHRVVHGGVEFAGSTRIDVRVKASIARLAELAPLHNPPALEVIHAAEAALPGAVQVAVFDTAFYACLPAKAYVYPLPYQWCADWGVRRFGFHGISHQYCTRRAAELLGRDLAELRVVSCHLGGGCSAAAVKGGEAVATTMGFTTLEGLMMGTRSGSIDPGILLYLQRSRGLTVDQLEDALHHRSGLLGLSGVSPDLAQIEEAIRQGNSQAKLAFDVFADRVRSAVGSLAVTMGGVDALIFTDRIGEGSAALRAAVCEGLECLGLRLDPARNAGCVADADLASGASPARILLIHTREELMIAREARRMASGIMRSDKSSKCDREHSASEFC
jgi:acetate kinase